MKWEASCDVCRTRKLLRKKSWFFFVTLKSGWNMNIYMIYKCTSPQIKWRIHSLIDMKKQNCLWIMFQRKSWNVNSVLMSELTFMVMESLYSRVLKPKRTITRGTRVLLPLNRVEPHDLTFMTRRLHQEAASSSQQRHADSSSQRCG